MATGLHVTAQLLVLQLCVTRGLTFYFNYIDVKMESYRAGNITVEMSCFKDNYIQEYFLLYHYPEHCKMCKIRPENVTDLEISDTSPLCSYERQCTVDIASLMDWISSKCPVKCFWDWTNHKACFSEWYTIQYACEQIDKDECGENSKYCWRSGKCSLADNRSIICDCNKGFTGPRCQSKKKHVEREERSPAGKLLHTIYGPLFDGAPEFVKILIMLITFAVSGAIWMAFGIMCALFPDFRKRIWKNIKSRCTRSVPDDQDPTSSSDPNISSDPSSQSDSSSPSDSPNKSHPPGASSGKKDKNISDKDLAEAGPSSGTRSSKNEKARVLEAPRYYIRPKNPVKKSKKDLQIMEESV